MKILIDIDKNLYTRLFDNGETDAVDMLNACVAIRKGTPLPLSKECERIIDIAIKTLSQSRWIPVSDRLPERSVWVLAYCKTEDGYEYQDVLLIHKYSGLWCDNDEFNDTVIAWMPLPEPYKAESEEK